MPKKRRAKLPPREVRFNLLCADGTINYLRSDNLAYADCQLAYCQAHNTLLGARVIRSVTTHEEVDRG